MRFWEAALILFDMGQIVWILAAAPSLRGLRLFGLLAGVLVLVQLRLDGYRWQMMPAYLAAAILLMAPFWPTVGVLRLLMVLAALVCAGCSLILCHFLPVFAFPKPSGPFPVGTVILHLIDSSRNETFSSDPEARRELMIQLWYPAAPGGSPAAYVPRGATDWKSSHLALVRTAAMRGAPMAGDGTAFPLLIFCPSWNGGKAQNTFEALELASHGFVVAGIDHPYVTKLTVFPDGRVVPARLRQWLDYSSEAGLAESTSMVEEQLRIRSQDVLFVLSELEKKNKYDPSGLLSHRLDMGRLGIFGHSFGGAVAARICWVDPRFRAGIDMDGTLFGEVADAGVRQPFFFMSDDTPVPTADLKSPIPARRRTAMVMMRDADRIRASLAAHGGYELTLAGANHMNFSDGPLFCRLKSFTGAGTIAIGRAMEIVNRYTLAFFEQHLNGNHQKLLDAPSPSYPEAKFRNWDGNH